MAAPPPPPRKTEPSTPAYNYFAAVRRNASTRIKPEPTENHHPTDDGSITDDDEENHKPHPADFIVKQEDRRDEAWPSRAVGARRGVKRPSLPGPVSGMVLSLQGKHRRRLNTILQTSVREHHWTEAAGALSMLLTGIPNLVINASDDELRRYYMLAMELHRRSGGSDDRRYENWIRRIYDTWMARLSQSRDNSRKKNLILMELSLFYFTQGNVDGARKMMECVIHDDKLANEPSVNLLYGMILYQAWYSGLPEEYKIKGFESFDNCTAIGTFGAASDDRYRETEIGVSSSNRYAAVTELSSQCASESSYGNRKVYMDCENDRPKTKFGVASPPQEFYGSHSTDKNEQKFGSYYPDDSLRNTSIFFAHGLDTSLLPIRLDHLTGDIQKIICRYRDLADGYYTDALKHLRLALHSIQSAYAALLPLVQLLLLGDQVEEAFKELENSCHHIDAALPFRLMARLLECFQSHKVTQICSYYENALRRDPICYQTLERLVKIHKSGNYSTMMLFEMIALHLDAADGQCSIWEEFASCFLQLQASAQSEYEDCTSENILRGRNKIISGSKIPIALTEANARASWKLRFVWWKRRHFSNSCLKEQTDDRKTLCFKAACASHLYGPTYDYVVRIFKSLREEGDHNFSILNAHMQKAMNLLEHL